MLHKRHKHDLIIIFALIAFGVSIYLSVTSSLGVTVPCSTLGGCEAVLNSKFSKLFGLPLSYFGVLYFGGAVIGGLLANHYAWGRKLLTVFLAVGLLSAVIFLGLQFLIIRQICQYCLIVDLIAVALFLWDYNIDHLEK